MSVCLQEEGDQWTSSISHEIGEVDYALASFIARSEISTYSTAFSGVDSPGTAYAQLRASCCNLLSSRNQYVPHEPRHIHGVDPWTLEPLAELLHVISIFPYFLVGELVGTDHSYSFLNRYNKSPNNVT